MTKFTDCPEFFLSEEEERELREETTDEYAPQELVSVFSSLYQDNGGGELVPVGKPRLGFKPIDEFLLLEGQLQRENSSQLPAEKSENWFHDPINATREDAALDRPQSIDPRSSNLIPQRMVHRCILESQDFIAEKYAILKSNLDSAVSYTRREKAYVKRGLTLVRRLKSMVEFMRDLDDTTSALTLMKESRKLAELLSNKRVRNAVRKRDRSRKAPIPDLVRSDDSIPPTKAQKDRGHYLQRYAAAEENDTKEDLERVEAEKIAFAEKYDRKQQRKLAVHHETLNFPFVPFLSPKVNAIAAYPEFIDVQATGVENQSSKEEIREKRMNNRCKDLSSENKQLRKRLQDAVDKLARLRVEREEIRREMLKSLKQSHGIDTPENQADIEVLANLDKLVNITMLHRDFCTAALETLEHGEWGTTSNGPQICSIVCKKMVANALELDDKTVNEHFQRTASTPSQYHHISEMYVKFMKDLPYRENRRVVLYPDSWTNLFNWTMTNPDHFPNVTLPVSSVPSGSASRISFVTKLCTYITSVATSDSWTEMITETLKMIVYTATPEQIDVLLQSAGTRDLRSFVEARLRASADVPEVKPKVPHYVYCLEEKTADPNDPTGEKNEGTPPPIIPDPPVQHEVDASADTGLSPPVTGDTKVYTYTPRPFSREAVEVAMGKAKVVLQKSKEKLKSVRNQNIFDDGREWIRFGINIDQKIAEIPLLHVIDEAVCLAVFAFHDPTTKLPSSWAYRELLTRATKVHRTDALGLFSRICSVADSVLMICSTLHEGVEPTLIMNPLNVELRLANLTGFYTSYLAGNLDSGKCKEVGFSMADFEREAGKLSDDIEVMLKNKMIKPQATRTFCQFRAQALAMKMKVGIMIKARTNKDMPYFVGVFGEPGVGKTSSCEVVARVCSVVYDENINISNTWTPSDDPNSWDNGATSATRFIKCPEHNSRKDEDSQAGQILFRMTTIADTLPSEWNKADLETKGSAFNFTVGGWVACNQKDFGIPKYISSIEAISRRFDFFELTVKPEFGKQSEYGNHLVPDAEKIRAYSDAHGYTGDLQYPDVHLIQRYTFIQKIVGDKDDSGASRYAEIKPIGAPMSNTEWAKFMLKRARQVKKEARIYIKSMEAARAEVYCEECASAPVMCRCEGGFKCKPPEPVVEIAKKGFWKLCEKFSPAKLAEKAKETFPEPEKLPSLSKDPPPKDPDVVENQAEEYRYYPTFDLGISAWVTDLLHATVCKFLNLALTSVFNGKGIFVAFVAGLCLGGPPLAFIAALFMFMMTCIVGTVSKAAADFTVRRQVRDGVPPRYWDNSIIEVGVLLLAVGGSLAIYSTYRTAKKKEKRAESLKRYKQSCAYDTVYAIGRHDQEYHESENEVVDQVFNPTTPEEVKLRNAREDNWIVRQTIPVDVPYPYKSMVHDQVAKKIIENQVRVVVHSGEKKIGSTATFITGNLLLVVDHSGEFAKGNKLDIHFRNGHERMVYIKHWRRNTMRGVEVDSALIQVSTRFPFRDIQYLFENSPTDTEWASRRPAVLHTSDPQEVMACFCATARTEQRHFAGWQSRLSRDTVAGDCGAVLIAQNNPAYILGFHVALCPNTGSQCLPFEYNNYKEFLKAIPAEDQARVTHKQMFFKNSRQLNQPIAYDEPSERVCTNHLRKEGGPECTNTAPMVFSFGHKADTRLSGSSKIVNSVFSEALVEEGIPCDFEKGKLENNRVASTILQHASRGCGEIPVVVHQLVRRSIVTKAVKGMKELELEDVRELTFEEAVHGMPDHAFVKPMALNKAYGGGVAGKKIAATHLTPLPQDGPVDDFPEVQVFPMECLFHRETGGWNEFERHMNEERSVATTDAVVEGEPVRAINPGMEWPVVQILRDWGKNISNNAIYHFAIKDAPFAKGKNKPARGVTSPTFPYHIAHTIVFGHIVGHMRLCPFLTGCYEGIDYRSSDWDSIARHHMLMKGKAFFIDLDTAKMDTSLSPQDIELCVDVLADIAEGMGASAEHVAKMRTAGRDFALPACNLFGEFLFMPMNMSGSKLTITMNNIAGVQSRIRVAYMAYRICEKLFPGVTEFTSEHWEDVIRVMEDMEETSTILDDFDQYVRVGSIGDDCMVSTLLQSFNMSFISGFFKHLGVTITGSAKTDSVEDNLPLSELACCQRGFRWSDEWNGVVGNLGEKSMNRMLHMREPSKEEPQLVDAAIITNYLEECVFHGREFYEDRSARLFRAIVKSGQDCYHGREPPSYDSVLKILLTRYPPNPDSPARRYFKDVFLGKASGAVPKAHQGELTPVVMTKENSELDWLPSGDWTVSTRLSSSDESCEASDDLRPPQIPLQITISELIKNQSLVEASEPATTQMQNLEVQTTDGSTEVISIPSSMFPMYQSVTTSDTMEDVTMRPIKLFSLSWDVDSQIEQHFDPWRMVLTNQTILNKMQYFRFFQGEIELTVMIEGNSFHSGLCWLTYIPLRGVDEFSQYTRGEDADLVEMSQRMPLTISPRDSRGGQMILPFMYNRDALDLLSRSLSQLGIATLKSIVPLRMANGGRQPCIVTILARIRRMKTYMPTNHAFTVKNQSLDSASSNAEVTTSLQTGTTHPIASARAGTVRTSAEQMWQERSDLTYSSLGQIETYIGTLNWSSNAGQDFVLQSLRCSPFHGITKGPVGTGQEFHITPAAWCALPYTFWSGTVRYRFEIVCAPIHRGKLMFTWDPLYTRTRGEYNLNYSTIIDIGTKTEHSVEIGWGQDLPYLPTITGMSAMVGQSSSEYTNVLPHANGVLTMSVFSPLVIPNDEQEAVVSIVMYASMGPDFKLAVLRPSLLGMTPLKNSDNQDQREAGAIQASNPNPNEAPIAVVNPLATTSRLIEICEEPGPLLASRNLPGPNGIVDLAWAGDSADLNADRVKMGTGSYSLSKKLPLTTDFPMVLRVRGFVAGTTNLSIEIPSQTGGMPRIHSVTLTGITDTQDIIIPYLDDGVKFLGQFNVRSNNQVHLVKVIYHLPKWARLVLPDTGAFTFQPHINWYSLDGKTLLEDQSFTNRTGVSFRLRLRDDTQRPIGNVAVSYLATAAGQFDITAKQDGFPLGYLAPTGASEIRHFSVEDHKNLFVVVPATATITIRQVALIVYNDTAVRSAIKTLPNVGVVNQSAMVETSSRYGPSPKSSLRPQFFQEYHNSVTDALRHFSPAVIATTPNPQTGVAGHNVLKLDHFPFVYRVNTNTTNVNTYQRVNHLFEYFVRAFIGLKGSMEVEILHEPRGSTTNTAPTYGRITRVPADTIMTLASNTGLPTTGGYQGYEWFNTRLNARVAITLPWQSRERFAYARSTDVSNHIDYAYRYDHGTIAFERLVVSYRIGEDFVLGHFLCTPILVQA
jgi:hypothetical protein